MQAEGVVVCSESGIARVKVQRASGCGRCHEAGGCGGEGKDSACSEYRVDNALGARSGDRVLIEVPDGAALRAASLAYVLPLAGLLLGASGAYALWPSDGAAVLGACVGLLAAFGVMRILARRKLCEPRIAGVFPS